MKRHNNSNARRRRFLKCCNELTDMMIDEKKPYGSNKMCWSKVQNILHYVLAPSTIDYREYRIDYSTLLYSLPLKLKQSPILNFPGVKLNVLYENYHAISKVKYEDLNRLADEMELPMECKMLYKNLKYSKSSLNC